MFGSALSSTKVTLSGMNFKVERQNFCIVRSIYNKIDFDQSVYSITEKIPATFVSDTEMQCIIPNRQSFVVNVSTANYIALSISFSENDGFVSTPLEGQFEYIDAGVNSLTPNMGPVYGGDFIYVEGHNFDEMKETASRALEVSNATLFCSFAGVPSPETIYINSSFIKCMVPPASHSQIVPVKVEAHADYEGENIGGKILETDTKTAFFRYYSEPVLDSITPACAERGLHNLSKTEFLEDAKIVTLIQGQGFLNSPYLVCGVDYYIDDENRSILCPATYISPTAISCDIPRLSSAQEVYVSILMNGMLPNPNEQTLLHRIPFLFHDAIEVDYILPLNPVLSSMVTVSVFGEHFLPSSFGLICKFNNTLTTAIYVNETLVLCTGALLHPGDTEVSVSNNGEIFYSSPQSIINGQAPFKISSIFPTKGYTSDEALIHVFGSGFPVASSLTSLQGQGLRGNELFCVFDGSLVSPIEAYLSSTEVICKMPWRFSPGEITVEIISYTYDVSEVDDDKNRSVALDYENGIVAQGSLTYFYIEPLNIDSVIPNKGAMVGGQHLYIYGEGFRSTISMICTFSFNDGDYILTVKALYLTDTQIMCTSPNLLESELYITLEQGEEIDALLTITYDDGLSNASSIKGLPYTFSNLDFHTNLVQESAPVMHVAVASVSPAIGVSEGGTFIDIIGLNFIENQGILHTVDNNLIVKFVPSDWNETMASHEHEILCMILSNTLASCLTPPANSLGLEGGFGFVDIYLQLSSSDSMNTGLRYQYTPEGNLIYRVSPGEASIEEGTDISLYVHGEAGIFSPLDLVGSDLSSDYGCLFTIDPASIALDVSLKVISTKAVRSNEGKVNDSWSNPFHDSTVTFKCQVPTLRDLLEDNLDEAVKDLDYLSALALTTEFTVIITLNGQKWAGLALSDDSHKLTFQPPLLIDSYIGFPSPFSVNNENAPNGFKYVDIVLTYPVQAKDSISCNFIEEMPSDVSRATVVTTLGKRVEEDSSLLRCPLPNYMNPGIIALTLSSDTHGKIHTPKWDLQEGLSGRKWISLEFLSAPMIYQVTPQVGGCNGSTPITLFGENFVDIPHLVCTFSYEKYSLYTNATFISPSQISCSTPAPTWASEDDGTEMYSVLVGLKSNVSGFDCLTKGIFHFNQKPSILHSLSPSYGPISGGTLLSIYGDGFYSYTESYEEYNMTYKTSPFCKLGTVTVPAVIMSDSLVECVAPSFAGVDFQEEAQVEVFISLNGLDFLSSSEPLLYKFYMDPVLEDVSPKVVPAFHFNPFQQVSIKLDQTSKKNLKSFGEFLATAFRTSIVLPVILESIVPLATMCETSISLQSAASVISHED